MRHTINQNEVTIRLSKAMDTTMRVILTLNKSPPLRLPGNEETET